MTTYSRFVFAALLTSLAFGLGIVSISARATTKEKADKQLAHSVFFALKDTSKASVDKFVASCHKYLSGHEGTVSFEVGARAEDVEEPVSVKDWQVALLIVFESKEAGAKYLKAPRHLEFVQENKNDFAGVRVFDSYLTTKP